MTQKRRRRTRQKNRDTLKKLVSLGHVTEENINAFLNLDVINSTTAAECERISDNEDISDGNYYF
jgi:hypothetical protein